MYREEQLKALLAGHRILIAGYGREGKSAERLIQRLLPDADYTVATQVESGKWKTESGEWRQDWPFDMVIKSPGIPNFQFSILNFQLTSLTDLFLQVYGDLTIGVTGTKGKSTTASLIHHLLPGSILAGNIGIPLFDILDDLHEDSLVVAELSCHQLENIHRGPHIAVLLNLFQEHLDHYEDYLGYKMAKMQIALRQQPGDHFFYCTDNQELSDLTAAHVSDMRSMLHPYSLSNATADERRLIDACPLKGEHNRSNILVACRVYTLLSQAQAPDSSPGLGELPNSKASVTCSSPKLGEGDRRAAVVEECVHRLSIFHGLRHRIEYLGNHAGIHWYDDSISTIPEAAIAAVQALGRVDTLILGGFDRGIDYSPLVDFLTEHPVPNLVFVGQAGRRINSQFSILNSQFLVEDDYTKIVPWCATHTPQGGVVLLSPAAASYDAFKNFEHRGDFFAELIKRL
ncbi:MAG: UDP-N-acetylmuramoyl-L-alanine--D-glutamate ligase [Bacteroidales bacterium]|nr:UDP-N-acetylmuramoyl-L-alanine--D-glutamate ligase [Bacteroidales bacterium]